MWKFNNWNEIPDFEPKLLPRYLKEGREMEVDVCPLCASNRFYKFDFWLKLGKTIFCVHPDCPNGISNN